MSLLLSHIDVQLSYKKQRKLELFAAYSRDFISRVEAKPKAVVPKVEISFNNNNLDLIDRVVLGGGFKGSGGGGPVDISRIFAQTLKEILTNDKTKSIKIVDAFDVEDNDICATIASMGSPASLTSDHVSLDTFTNTFSTLNAAVKGNPETSQGISYVMPVEIGSWNSLAPFAVAVEFGIPVIDGEGAGRAVPTLDLTSISYGNTSPAVIASDGASSNATKITIDVETVDELQTLASVILPSGPFGSVGGVGLWAVTGAFVKQNIVERTYTEVIFPQAQIMIDAYNNGGGFTYLADNTENAKIVATGKVTNISTSTNKALDKVSVTIEGVDGEGNHCTTTVFGVNENLYVYRDNMQLPAILSPDLSCWATLEQPAENPNASSIPSIQPLDNSNVKEGMDVCLIGILANRFVVNDPVMLQRWKSTIIPLGYAGPWQSGVFA